MQTHRIIAERSTCWDGLSGMRVVFNDGGRADAGWKGNAGDCVVRAIAIASEQPYQSVYDDLRTKNNNFVQRSRSQTAKRIQQRGSTPRNGNSKHVYRPYLESLGWTWTPTMMIGSGCKVHLCEGELPTGRLIVRVSKHLVAVIDGTIHDTYDPQRATVSTQSGQQRIARRCVYGYFSKAA